MKEGGEPVDADAEDAWAKMARAEVVGDISALIEALRTLGDVTKAARDAEIDVYESMRSAAFILGRGGDLMADYIRALGSAQALAQAAARDPVVWGLGEVQATIILEHAMAETAERARERLTGLIGGLVDSVALQIAEDMQGDETEVVQQAADDEWLLAADEVRAAFNDAEQTLAEYPDLLSLLLDAWAAYQEATMNIQLSSDHVLSILIPPLQAFTDLAVPGNEILERLNELAEVRASGPVTSWGEVPIAQDPRVAAEAVLTEADLDEDTRRQLLEALAVFKDTAAIAVSALEDFIEGLKTLRDETLAIIDALIAALRSMLNPV
ncbi:MAG: hypothetical protein H0T78_00970 [Longispora sp.]|nr:hypothetical protein [Longispora sp. (in: high G+C Gram-positive bacteria)]